MPSCALSCHCNVSNFLHVADLILCQQKLHHHIDGLVQERLCISNGVTFFSPTHWILFHVSMQHIELWMSSCQLIIYTVQQWQQLNQDQDLNSPMSHMWGSNMGCLLWVFREKTYHVIKGLWGTIIHPMSYCPIKHLCYWNMTTLTGVGLANMASSQP